MASKKKKSAKKKKAPPKKDAAAVVEEEISTPPPAPPTTTTSSGSHEAAGRATNLQPLPDRDSDKTTKRFLKGNGEKVNFERLIKRMPIAAQSLKDQKVSPEEVAKEVSNQYVASSACSSDLCIAITTLGWPRAVDASPFTEAETTLVLEFANDLHMKVGDKLLEIEKEQSSHLVQEEDNGMQDIMQQSYEETCRTWQRRLNRKYYGGQRLFLRNCLLYGMSKEDWKASLEKAVIIGGENLKKCCSKPRKLNKTRKLLPLLWPMD